MRAEARWCFRLSVITALVSSVLIALTVQPYSALFPLFLVITAIMILYQYSFHEIASLELPGFLDQLIYFGGGLVVLFSATWTSAVGNFGSLFVILSVVMSLGAVSIRWKGGISLLLWTAVFGALFSLRLDTVTSLSFGLPLFLSAVLVASIWRHSEDFTDSMPRRDFWQCISVILIFGLIIAVALWTWGIVGSTIQPEWSKSTIESHESSSTESSGGMTYLVFKIGLLFVLASLMMGGIYWIVRKLKQEQEEVVGEVDIPSEESMGVEKVNDDRSINLQQAVRGGKKAQVLNQVHELLNQCEGTDKARRTHETVKEFFIHQFGTDPTSLKMCKFAGELYASARYGYHEPTKDELNQLKKNINQFRERL